MMSPMIVIRQASLHDLPGAYRVCLLTGNAGADATGLLRNPDLLGHLYVGPYLAGEPGFALVAADEDGVAGYCLAAPDTTAFAAWAEREWWPALRAEFPLRSDGSEDAALIELIHRPVLPSPAVIEAFPAHLHIDLHPRVRGTGTARRLVERQLAHLADAGAAACHLAVAAANDNAIGFYTHLGWRVLERHADEWFMGIELR
jgi:ribosomal protein S18 acetylase RimI-like enzyme